MCSARIAAAMNTIVYFAIAIVLGALCLQQPACAKQADWNEHLNRAYLYQQKGLSQFACDEYKAAIATHASSIPSVQYMKYLLELREYGEAEQVAHAAEARWKNCGKLYRVHAKLLLSQLRLDEAQKLAQQATRTNPDDDQLWSMDVLCALAMKKIDLADKETQLAQKHLPHSERIALLPYAVSLAEQKFEEIAVEAKKNNVRVAKGDSAIPAFQIAALEKTGDLNAAAELYLNWFRARKFDPAFAASACAYLLKQNKATEALEPAVVALCHHIKDSHLSISEALQKTTEGRLITQLLKVKTTKQETIVTNATRHFSNNEDKQLVCAVIEGCKK